MLSMKRMGAIEEIVNQLNDELVVCNIGFPSRELYAVKDSSKHFYMLGSMGMASSIGLGLALSQDQKVIVFEGDGSVLMNMGSLVTIYAQSPKNLVLVILDNECYGSTGCQDTYSSEFDFANVCKSIGFKNVFSFSLGEKIDFTNVLSSEGPCIVHVKIERGNSEAPVINLSPKEIINRFMDEVQLKKIKL